MNKTKLTLFFLFFFLLRILAKIINQMNEWYIINGFSLNFKCINKIIQIIKFILVLISEFHIKHVKYVK